MYLHKIQLENIKCFENLEIDFVDGRNKPRSMTVILGDNGVGKSTLLQAIAITLGGEKVASFMQSFRGLYAQDSSDWVQVGSKQGRIQAAIYPGKSEKDAPRRKLHISYLVTGDEAVEEDGTFYDQFTISAIPSQDLKILRRTAYADHTQGWLAYGYGPLRQFSEKQTFQTQDKIYRFASLFGENQWLISKVIVFLSKITTKTNHCYSIPVKMTQHNISNLNRPVLFPYLNEDDKHGIYWA